MVQSRGLLLLPLPEQKPSEVGYGPKLTDAQKLRAPVREALQRIQNRTQIEADAMLGVEDLPILDDSDSSGEMALIAESFKKKAAEHTSSTQQLRAQQESAEKGVESTGQSSLDATLSEVRDQVPSQKTRRNTTVKKTSRPKRVQHRGVPIREECLSKIGWTRSFISGPADPLHNPHMVWCHMCKKNFSVKTKGTVEILRHHRS